MMAHLECPARPGLEAPSVGAGVASGLSVRPELPRHIPAAAAPHLHHHLVVVVVVVAAVVLLLAGHGRGPDPLGVGSLRQRRPDPRVGRGGGEVRTLVPLETRN